MDKTKREELYQKEINRLDTMSNCVVGVLKEAGLTLEEINYVGSAICAQYMAQAIKSQTNQTPDYNLEDLAKKSEDLHNALGMKSKEMGFDNIEYDYFVANSNHINSILTLQTILFDENVFPDSKTVGQFLRNITSYNPMLSFLLDIKSEQDNKTESAEVQE